METNKLIDLDKTNDILENNIAVIPTGISSLDEMLGGGLRSGSLTLIASRPAVGKTSLTMQLAGNITAAGKFVYFCSLESNEYVFNRIFRKQNGANPARETLYFDDHAKADVPYIAEKIRSLEKCDAVFVDYLELMQPHRSTSDAVAEIVLALNELAQNEDIQIVLTCQIRGRGPLPKCFDEHKMFCPELSERLQNIAQVQTPDVIILLSRELFHVEDSETYEKAELIVSKNRYGATGVIPVHWNPEKLKYEEQDE